MVDLSPKGLEVGAYELCGLLFDYIIFYALNNKRKFYLSDIIFFFITFPILFILQDFGMPITLIVTLLEIFIFWLFYQKKFGSLQTLTTVVLTNFLSLAVDSTLGELKDYKIFSFPYFSVLFYLLVIFILAWVTYHFKFTKFLTKNNDYYLLSLIIFSFVTLLLAENFSKSTVLIFILFQFIFLIFLLRYYQKKEAAQQLERENKNLDIYLQTLQIEQDKLHAFKHDYQDLLKSLTHNVNSKQLKEILPKLDVYSTKQISTNELNISELNNISNPYLKSLMIEKFNQIYEYKIPYTFECTMPTNIPSSINIFDLIRIIGIGYNNAIEESLKLQKINKIPEIRTMIHQPNSEELEITIKNRTSPQNKTDNLTQRRVTTKAGHSGLGLANVVEIITHYDSLSFYHSQKNGWFTFTLTIFNK
ncbi:GHKL domain-containing protein [Lactobacillus sp. PV037]|uniref:GHKL domain-containing protein n=1 Tax=Lactobacillus sp. PV037 TaxID=2594496 RepID=UPI00223ED685|nr:GHKL domain-containing protein [Lactobacillus sp. PV037]QNQ84383.1 GHKL domain-containing protein [Lactobacillus sp. PV037]